MDSSDHKDDPDRLVLAPYDLERMNLPPEFWRVKPADITHPRTKRVITRYLKHINERFKDGHGMRLYGAAGVGKTSIAAMIAKEARTWKYTVLFMMIWELREAIRSRIQFDENVSIQDRCREVDFLVLDGFVDDDINERLVNALFLEQLITYRGQRGKVTIITTRIGAREFETAKGLSAFDAGTKGYCYPFKVDGDDQRASRVEDMRAKILGEDG